MRREIDAADLCASGTQCHGKGKRRSAQKSKGKSGQTWCLCRMVFRDRQTADALGGCTHVTSLDLKSLPVLLFDFTRRTTVRPQAIVVLCKPHSSCYVSWFKVVLHPLETYELDSLNFLNSQQLKTSQFSIALFNSLLIADVNCRNWWNKAMHFQASHLK